MIELDGEEYDVNACVSIQFNILQKLLLKMSQKEKFLQDKIIDLEKKLNNHDEKFNNIENSILNLSQNKQVSTTIIEKVIEKEEGKEYDSNDIKTTSNDVKDDKDENSKRTKKDSFRTHKREMSIKEENEEYEEEDENDEKEKIKEKILKGKKVKFTKKKK